MWPLTCKRCGGPGHVEMAAHQDGGPNVACMWCGHRVWLVRRDGVLAPYHAPGKPKHFQEPRMAGEIRRSKGAA